MSFNPVSVLPASTKDPVSTLEISRGKRLVQVALACIYCLLSAGVVFGYAAFKPVLVKEGVYKNLCTDNGSDNDLKTCYAQEIRLNLMFTSAAVVTNVVALPVGTILDKFGPRVCGIIGSFFLALGSGLLIIASYVTWDAYIPGYVFLALGGPFVFISSFQLSNCFPRHSGLILALLTGAFDTSSAVLLVYRLIYDGSQGRFTPQRFFTAYLVVPAFILLTQLFFMPAESYKTVGEIVSAAENNTREEPLNDGATERQGLLDDQRKARRESILSELSPLLNKKDSAEVEEQEERKKRISRVWGALHGLSAFQQIRTPWWILITVFVMLQMLRINYFVATVRSQYDYMLGDYGRAARVNSVFDIALPLGGVVSIPFIGLILDNLSTPVNLALLVGLATIIGLAGIIPFESVAYVNITLFVLYRPLYYTAVSDYAAKVFGFHTFGKVYGLIICVSGLFNFSQSALDALTHKSFGDNPLPVNLILLSSTMAIGIILVTYVYRKSITMSRSRLEELVEEGTEV